MNDSPKKPLPKTEKSGMGRPPVKTGSDVEAAKKPAEVGGRGGADPTRFGDWEKDGRCVDF